MKEQQLVRLSMIDAKRKVKIIASLVEKDNNPKLEKAITDAKVKLADVVLNGGGDDDTVKKINQLEKELEEWVANRSTPDVIDVTEVSAKVSEYVIDKLKIDSDEPNAVRDQVAPFVAAVMSMSMVKIAGLDMAHFLLVSDLVRQTMIFNMTVAFLTYKFLQTHNYQITTEEEPVSAQEIADLRRMNKEQEVAALAAIMGVPLDEFKKTYGGSGEGGESSRKRKSNSLRQKRKMVNVR